MAAELQFLVVGEVEPDVRLGRATVAAVCGSKCHRESLSVNCGGEFLPSEACRVAETRG